MDERYDVCERASGWAVIDLWTGQPVVLARVPQDDLSFAEALALKIMLDRRAARTVILQ